MSLRDLAATDLQAIVNNSNDGFGYAIELIDPAGVIQPLTGFSNDISLAIDPDTGMQVAGRTASVALSYLDLTTIPVNDPSETATPWQVRFLDVKGESYTFIVGETVPDRAIGCVVLILEEYTP